MSFLRKNYVFTWACGEEFFNSPGFRVFLSAFNRNRFADLVVFSDKFHQMWDATLHAMGHETVLVTGVYYLLRDRWHHYAKTLYQLKADAILLCDSKDIIFQDDPFQIIDDLDIKGEFVIFCDEGITHGENDWNGGDQFRCQIHVVGEWKKTFLDRPVLNGGFILGTPKKLAQLAIMIWSNMIRNPQPPYSDQAMLNFLYFWIENDPEVFVCNPVDHNLCITGQGIVEEKVHYMVKDENFFNLLTDKKYYAFHQWDRTEWADKLTNTYDDALDFIRNRHPDRSIGH
tara:strand:+ start:3686 stop:4543 length:858 start_codon:yes stop_codon:yes gene_type:complete